MPDIILTGLPRSGATLVSALIDQLPNAVSFNAPPHHLAQVPNLRHAVPYCKWLAGDYMFARAQLLRQEPLLDIRAQDGSPLLDGLYDSKQARNDAGEWVGIPFTRAGLEGDFILAMKQHTLFTALLPTLLGFGHFTVIAVIRHPRDVIASWLRLPAFPVTKSNTPGLKILWPEAHDIIQSTGDLADRLVQLYDLHIQRYHELRQHIHIVKYEDVIETPMLISTLLNRPDISPAAKLIKPATRTHSADEMDLIKGAIRKYGVFTKQYYPEF